MRKNICKFMFKVSAFFRMLAHRVYPEASRQVIGFSKHPYKEKTLYLNFKNLITEEMTEQCALDHGFIRDVLIPAMDRGDL